MNPEQIDATREAGRLLAQIDAFEGLRKAFEGRLESPTQGPTADRCIRRIDVSLAEMREQIAWLWAFHHDELGGDPDQ